MNISGAGITLYSTVKILKGFTIDTQPALEWTKLASGNWACTDRGVSSDLYTSEITFAGTQVYINDIITLFESNREAGTGVANQITLSSFSNDEKIFGEDLVYTGNITANVMSIQQRTQGSWKGFNLTMKVAAVSPTFISGSGALPIFRFADVGYAGDSDWTVDHQSSYDRTWYNPDKRYDSGTFVGRFTFSVNEMVQLRSYIRQLRGNTMTLTNIHGVARPFGPKEGDIAGSGYPYQVKVLKFTDLGKVSENYYKCEITFGEVLP